MPKKMTARQRANARAKRLVRKHRVKGVNQPRFTHGHKTKKGLVVMRQGNNVKLIRFGDQKMGHNFSPAARKAFKTRHRRNIRRGKTSAAYWSDKFLWNPSGPKRRK
jgi:hypothetical protein